MARFGLLGTQYFSASGEVLGGGEIFFFDSGTNTPKTTFKDINLQIPNTNPVILTAAGRLPGSVFFDGAANGVLTDSTGQQIEQLDPIGGEVTAGAFSAYNAQLIYSANDLVIGSDTLYYSSIGGGNVGNDPTTTSGIWMEVFFINDYEATKTFSEGEFARGSDNNLYISRIDSNLGNDPTTPSPTEWRLVTSNVDNGTVEGQAMFWDDTAGQWKPTDALSIDDAGGDVTVATGNLVMGTSGKGIDFSATAGSGASELFADYEEGTFTPVLSDGTNDATSSIAVGRYTKIGHRLFFDIFLQTSSLDSVSGGVQINGLPFTSVGVGNYIASTSVGLGLGLAIGAGESVTGRVGSNTAHILLALWNVTIGVSALDATNWTADGQLVISGSYEV